jgi:hypothetical protein
VCRVRGRLPSKEKEQPTGRIGARPDLSSRSRPAKLPVGLPLVKKQGSCRTPDQ